MLVILPYTSENWWKDSLRCTQVLSDECKPLNTAHQAIGCACPGRHEFVCPFCKELDWPHLHSSCLA